MYNKHILHVLQLQLNKRRSNIPAFGGILSAFQTLSPTSQVGIKKFCCSTVHSYTSNFVSYQNDKLK